MPPPARGPQHDILLPEVSKVKQREEKKNTTRAKDALKKALFKHNLLKSSVQKKFKYDKKDKNSYSLAASLTAKETQARDKLIGDFQTEIKEGQQFDEYLWGHIHDDWKMFLN